MRRAPAGRRDDLGVVPVRTVTPASDSSLATSRAASSPNTASGAGSGVTRCSSRSAHISYARSASISASSYSGSGQVLPAGTTNASRRRYPSSTSWTMPCSRSWSVSEPVNVVAPWNGSTGCAPEATSRTS